MGKLRSMTMLMMLTLVAAGCATVPITGRQQMTLVPESLVLSSSLQEYDQFIAENTLSRDAAATRMVRQVGSRIQAAVTQYFTGQNQLGMLNGYAWEFNLVQDTAVNAWCMPGGKVVVYTGLLPVTKNEAGLAVVMGHEIAHAVARHGSERLSQQLLVSGGALALDQVLKTKSAESRELWGTVYGYGAQLGYVLPYSRTHETEADRLGLIFMAMAGYDPQTAVSFWERMASQSAGAPPELLSTHPSDTTRIANIKNFLTEAAQYYRPVR